MPPRSRGRLLHRRLQRCSALTHAVPTSKTYLPIQFHGKNTPALPVARKGQSGRLLRRPQQDYPAAPVADFCTAVLSRRRRRERCPCGERAPKGRSPPPKNPSPPEHQYPSDQVKSQTRFPWIGDTGNLGPGGWVTHRKTSARGKTGAVQSGASDFLR